MSEPSEAAKALRFILKDVVAESLSFSGGGLRLVGIPHNMPAPYLVKIVLERFVGADFAMRPFEKTAWVTAVGFRGSLLVVSFEKFGLRVRARATAGEESALVQAFADVLQRAIPQAERAIEPEIHSLIREGRITIPNQFHLFRDRYDYLRGLAIANFSSDPPPPVKRSTAHGEVTTSDPFKPEREGFFAGSAALDAYFSWLEHALILLLPFSGFDARRDDLESLITDSWAEKFKRVFNLRSSSVAKIVYEQLRRVKREHRNPTTHGGFDRSLNLIHVQVPEVGAIPARLSKATSNRLSLHPLTDASFTEICEQLDSADSFLRDGTHQLGFRFVSAGLDVYFNPESVSMYERALADPANFTDFIDHIAWQQDSARNMDW